MSLNTKSSHQLWLDTPGQKGQPHKDTDVRMVMIPPNKSPYGWDISWYLNRWSLIEEKLQ
jgi:hypothetical protein